MDRDSVLIEHNRAVIAAENRNIQVMRLQTGKYKYAKLHIDESKGVIASSMLFIGQLLEKRKFREADKIVPHDYSTPFLTIGTEYAEKSTGTHCIIRQLHSNDFDLVEGYTAECTLNQYHEFKTRSDIESGIKEGSILLISPAKYKRIEQLQNTEEQ